MIIVGGFTSVWTIHKQWKFLMNFFVDFDPMLYILLYITEHFPNNNNKKLHKSDTATKKRHTGT